MSKALAPHKYSKVTRLLSVHMHVYTCTLLLPSTQSLHQPKDSQSFSSVPVVTVTPASHTHSVSLLLRPRTSDRRYGFVRSWRQTYKGMDKEREVEMKSAEWTLGSKLLCQSIFPLGTLDESCPNSLFLL